MPEKNELPKLSEALKGEYELHGYAPGIFEISGFGRVDMTTISLELAHKINKSGLCPHLVKLENKSTKAVVVANS